METMQMRETTAEQYEALTLDELLREINDEHREAEQAVRDAVAHARQAGRRLLHVKDNLLHGRFMAWVDQYCAFSHRTATMYMRIAREWDRIITPNWQAVANLGITGVDTWLTQKTEATDHDPSAAETEEAVDEQVEADPLDQVVSRVDGAAADLRAALEDLRQKAVGRIEVREADVCDMLRILTAQPRACFVEGGAPCELARGGLLARLKEMQRRRLVLLGRWPADGGLLKGLLTDDGGTA